MDTKTLSHKALFPTLSLDLPRFFHLPEVTLGRATVSNWGL